MSKPASGKDWLIKCPNCGNNKSKVIIYKDYEKHTCYKCGSNYDIKKED